MIENSLDDIKLEMLTAFEDYFVHVFKNFESNQLDENGLKHEELMKEFDEIVKELLYLCEDKDILIKRIEELAKGGTVDDRSK